MARPSKVDSFHFELYKIEKWSDGIFVEKKNAWWNQESAEKIKSHITWFFELKNSYSKHFESENLPKDWLRYFSEPIKNVFDKKDNEIDFRFLLDWFIREWLSPQSHNMAKRDKYILIIYKRNEFFILAHLSVKKWLTLEWNNIWISNLLFSPDTLLRYIHITKKDKYDLVIREQTQTKTFMEFLKIDEEYLNKESCWELSFIWKMWNMPIILNPSPTELFQQYINWDISFSINNWKIIYMDESWWKIEIEKIMIWKDIVKNLDETIEISFYETLAINYSIKQELENLSQLSLFSDKVLIEEEKEVAKIWDVSIQKQYQNNSNFNCVYLLLPLWKILKQKELNYKITTDFLNFINKVLSTENAKKTIILSPYEKKPWDYVDKWFNEIYNKSSVFFPNLSAEENEVINGEIKKTREKIKWCDSKIMKELYLIYMVSSLLFYLKNYEHLSEYFKLLLNYNIENFATLKWKLFSEIENEIIEYKSWKALHFEENRESSFYNRIKNDINKKIEKINPWCILYWFDESKRELDWIDKNDFRKLSDDKLYEFQEKIKKESDLDDLHIYKIPWTINIVFVYIRKSKI